MRKTDLRAAQLTDAEKRERIALRDELFARVRAQPEWPDLQASLDAYIDRNVRAELDDGSSEPERIATKRLVNETLDAIVRLIRKREPVLAREYPQLGHWIAGRFLLDWIDLHPERSERERAALHAHADGLMRLGAISEMTPPEFLRERLGRLPKAKGPGRPRKESREVPAPRAISTPHGALPEPLRFVIRTEPGLPRVDGGYAAHIALIEACLTITLHRCPERWSNGEPHEHGRELDEPTLAEHFGVSERTLRAFLERWTIGWPRLRADYEAARAELQPDASWIPDLCKRCGKRPHAERSPYCEECI